ncbi:hypothetical protein L6452_35787 [Arctium lappa]|uniref:Uncharacterized protein n=1 Tax=Arctium lappa TaxID=4217 RepID=A0ACB8Y852_ARCLA|nr:hypothetical protein L6452_35787 [Arctium lappa]
MSGKKLNLRPSECADLERRSPVLRRMSRLVPAVVIRRVGGGWRSAMACINGGHWTPCMMIGMDWSLRILLRPISPSSAVKAIMLEKSSVEPFPNGSKVVPAIAGERLSVFDKCSMAGQKYSDVVLLKI